MTEQEHSEQWSKLHLAVTDLLNDLLNCLVDRGYNPSHHISYDDEGHHLLLDETILNKHPDVARAYSQYRDACTKRELESNPPTETP